MAELKQVLTPEQYTKLEAMQAKAKDRMKEHRAEKKAAPVK
jgi:Spy/CpxP family protein refolding chaperone